MRMANLINFNSFLNANRVYDSTEKKKELANKTNQDEELKHSTLQQHRMSNTYISESRLISTQDKLDKIKDELKKFLNQGNPEAWLAKPKLITKNHISNPKGMTKTSHKLLEQLSNANVSNKLKGGLSQIKELVNQHVGKSGYQQDLHHYSGYRNVTNASNAPTLNISQVTGVKTQPQQSYEFTLTTKSDKTIRFSLSHYSSNNRESLKLSGLSIRFEQSDKLNADEQKELTAFTKNLEAFMDAFFDKEQADFSILQLNEFENIQHLSFKAENLQSKNHLIRKYGLSFEYNNTDTGKHIKASFKNNHAEMRINKAEPFNVNVQDRQQALNHYLDLLDESKEKSQANQMQLDMMKSIFNLAFKPTEREAKEMAHLDSLRKASLNSAAPSQEAKSKQAFIPLSDFSFSFDSNKSDDQEHDIRGMASLFDLKLSIESTEHRSSDKIMREQKQCFNIQGLYKHKSSDGLSRKEVAYQYAAEKTIRTVLEKGKLISASIIENSLADVHKRFYGTNPRTGEPDALLYEEHKITKHTSIKDITELLISKEKLDAQKLLKETLIKPFKEGQVVHLKTRHYLDEYFAKRPYYFPVATNTNT